MLSYNLSEKNWHLIFFSKNKSISFFLLKTNFFKIQSQEKLSTKKVDSLSSKYPENKLRLLLMRLNHKTIKKNIEC